MVFRQRSRAADEPAKTRRSLLWDGRRSITGACPASFRSWLRPSKADDPSGPPSRLRLVERRLIHRLRETPDLFSVSDSSLDSAGAKPNALHSYTRTRPPDEGLPHLTIKFSVLLFYRRRRPVALKPSCLRLRSPCVVKLTCRVPSSLSTTFLLPRLNTSRSNGRPIGSLSQQGPLRLTVYGPICAPEGAP